MKNDWSKKTLCYFKEKSLSTVKALIKTRSFPFIKGGIFFQLALVCVCMSSYVSLAVTFPHLYQLRATWDKIQDKQQYCPSKFTEVCYLNAQNILAFRKSALLFHEFSYFICKLANYINRAQSDAMIYEHHVE